MVVSSDVFAIAAIFGLILLGALPTKPKRIINGVLLLVLGGIPLLATWGFLEANIYELGIYKFLAVFVVIIVGRTMFTEAIKEQGAMLKILSLIFGCLIILITTIPTMQNYGAIHFSLPAYPMILDFIVYVIAGVLTIIGAIQTSSY